MSQTYVLQCHIWLVDSEPPVWRRFQISDQLTLASLHTVLQVIMGWQQSHLYDFEVKGDRYAAPSPMPLTNTLDATTQVLADLQLDEGAKFLYTYDFGDGWLHQITVESKSIVEPQTELLKCLEGERACPPENSGGVWGYEELLERLNDPEDPEYEELLEWIGLEFDPDAFDHQKVNQRLQTLKGV
jgi:hypothetical protein